MTVSEVDAKEEEEQKLDIREKVRELTWKQPDLSFYLFEQLMKHLEISEEDQEEILLEAIRQWQNLA